MTKQRTIATHTLLTPLNPNQKQFIKQIKNKNNIITIGLGCPGTGKTLLALQTAIQMYNNEHYNIERIIYARPNVMISDEKDTGILPGGVIEKLWELCYPLLDNLPKIMTLADSKYIIESGVIEISNIGSLRGRSFSNSVVIIDEAQNATYKGLKTALTRIGENCHFIIIGDPEQTDLNDKHLIRSTVYYEPEVTISSTSNLDLPSNEDNITDEIKYGFEDDYDEWLEVEEDECNVINDYNFYLNGQRDEISALYTPIEIIVDKLKGLDNIKIIKFKKEDIVRSSIIQHILDRI